MHKNNNFNPTKAESHALSRVGILAKHKRTYAVVSLFAGCGGLDLGLEGGFTFLRKRYPDNGLRVVWANDNDHPSCETLKINFPKAAVVEGDIREILRSKSAIPEADVVVGGFPCQDFSLAGNRKGFRSQRGLLYQSMVETVRRVRPAVFVAENVKGLLSMNGGKAIKTIERDFAALGYNVTRQLYLAANYGVPQSRERVIIVGTDKRRGLPPFKHLEPVYAKDKWTTLKQAIGDLEKKAEGSMPNHYWSKAKMFPGSQGNSYVKADEIGPTMRAEHHGNIEWHWNKKRRLSAREAARIQSFPDSFVFPGSTSDTYRQVGNAVPPVMAWHIARAIKTFLDHNLKRRP